MALRPLDRARAARQTLRDLGPRWVAGRAWDIVRSDGLGALASNARRASSPGRSRLAHVEFTTRPNRPACEIFPGAVLLVSNVGISQCQHYRIEQKREAAAGLGLPFLEANPDDVNDMLSKLALSSVMVLYRVPWSRGVAQALSEAERLGVPTVFETDDAVYRRDLITADPNLRLLPRKLRRSVITGTELFMKTLTSCQHVCASTAQLAADLARHVPGRAFVIQNAVDAGMLEISDEIDRVHSVSSLGPSESATITITYGSGSLAHDSDFAVAAPALALLLDRRSEVEIRLIGSVSVPVVLSRHRRRIRRTPAMPFGDYLRELAASDITIAPLNAIEFNGFKSNIKFLEAAVAGTAFVGSDTVYGESVLDGVTGFVAGNSDEWFIALDRLAGDQELRAQIAKAAREHVDAWRLDVLAPSEYGALATAWPGPA